MKEAFPAMYKGIIASMTVNVLKAEPVAVLTEDDDVLIFTKQEQKGIMTNGDRIRQMTNEELADFLLESRSRCKLCKKRDEICEGAYHECWNGIDDWLKQEEDLAVFVGTEPEEMEKERYHE